MYEVRTYQEVPREVPEHLREYYDRLTGAGIAVTLPTAGPDFKLPEPVKLDGTPLSAIICESREGS
jgi:hypothetical protein